ncbi:MAG TPA: serine hydrolase, partial [Protaetiibacter sp.]|nr:serine hydrolase [Protaetiibacter sp.]
MAAPHDASDGVAQLGDLLQATGGADDAPVSDPAATRRTRRRRALIAGISTLVVVGVIGGYAGVTLSAPLPALTLETTKLRAPEPLAPATILTPPEGAWAMSVAGGDEFLGPDAAGIWATSGADEVRPIASITKLITALVILDAKPLAASDDPGPTLTFDKADHDLYDKYYVLGATIAKMPTGSSLSLHDVLEAMLVVSACNYAEAAAGWAFGSQSAFLTAARAWLAANGLEHTTIVEPTGIDARNVSTPRDLLTLGHLAMANPVIADIVASESLNVSGLDARSNTNTLLGESGVRGIKTGTLEGSGSNLLFSARLTVGGRDLDVTGVLLGGFSHEGVDSEIRAWLDSIVAGYQTVSLGEAGRRVGTVSTVWGSEADLVLASSTSLGLWSDTPITIAMTSPTVTTAVSGERVAEVTWSAGSATAT